MNLVPRRTRFIVGLSVLAAAVVSAAAPASASAQLADSRALTLDGVKEIVAAAAAEARANNWGVVIAVVDAGGHLLYLERMDGVQTGSVEVATEKARTAVAFRRPTLAFQEGIAAGNTAMLGIRQALPLEGGVPLMVDGHLVGGIGVSGVTSQQDGVIAAAGVRALEAMAGG
ncbi:MAG: heme-binding protein [Gemmatimonadales bacterium]|jgi:glc operon protein GlcG|nr:MAG: heme-binding protein [Gemmatimonadales bacterium]